MSFEWDPRKAKANLKKHGVSFDEASTVFDAPRLVTWQDVDHSFDEDRFLALGKSRSQRTLLVCYCYRFDVIRLISARKAAAGDFLF
jgi:uncharacterized DUF497 family protein